MKTNNYTLVLITVLFLIFLQPLQAQKTWKIDQSHASVNFSINHFFSEVTGKFRSFEGKIDFDPNNLTQSSVEFSIEVSSIDTDESDRDEHLKSPDFFNENEYPQIFFVSSSFKEIDKSNYAVKGKLTMRGVTKEIILPMKITGRMDNPWKEGYEILGISIKTTLNRTDYGVGTGSWAATAVVSDDVDVKINMELDGKK